MILFGSYAAAGLVKEIRVVFVCFTMVLCGTYIAIFVLMGFRFRVKLYATREPCFARETLVLRRAPAVPCCSACETPVTPNRTEMYRHQWCRGGKMAAASRDRKRCLSAAIRRRQQTAEVVLDGLNAELLVPMSYQPFDASSCIAGFETRSLPAEINHTCYTLVYPNYNFI